MLIGAWNVFSRNTHIISYIMLGLGLVIRLLVVVISIRHYSGISLYDQIPVFIPDE